MSELNRFKKEINLSEFAAARGYALDKRESSRSCAVMRHPNGEKIIVARNEESGDWVYFVIGNYQDNGTIIDFLQNRRGGSLGEVRKTLRDWLGSPRPQSLPVFARELLPISRDRVAVRVAWEAAKECAGLPSLTSRGLKPALFVTPRFKGCLRKDDRSNALFPHYDRDGLCGFEVKNRGFTGFAPGGIKGLWLSQVLFLRPRSCADGKRHRRPFLPCSPWRRGKPLHVHGRGNEPATAPVIAGSHGKNAGRVFDRFGV